MKKQKKGSFLFMALIFSSLALGEICGCKSTDASKSFVTVEYEALNHPEQGSEPVEPSVETDITDAGENIADAIENTGEAAENTADTELPQWTGLLGLDEDALLFEEKNQYLLEKFGADAMLQKDGAGISIVPMIRREPVEPAYNPYSSLSIPTYITKVKDTFFLVDCYHDQIIYHDTIEEPLTSWKVLPGDFSRPHTIASDGSLYLADDTENNRILVYEKWEDQFVNTYIISNVGVRPHYVVYDETSRSFLAWSSSTGELFVFSNEKDVEQEDIGAGRIALRGVLQIPALEGVYVRSFTIIDDAIYFVSGDSKIRMYSLETRELLGIYGVQEEIAGMVQLTKFGEEFLVTVSTDINGNQDFATILQVKNLADLKWGYYEDVYHHFIGGGTPYNITYIDNQYFLTEHRLEGYSVWSFELEEGKIANVKHIY